MIPAGLRVTAPALSVGPVAVYPWDAVLAQRLTIPSNFKDDEPMRLWVRLQGADGDFIGLPWHLAPPPTPQTDRRTAGFPVFLKSHVQPRPAQVEPIAKVKALLAQGRSFCLKAPTGSGKTIMMLDCIAAHGVSTIVIVPKDDLMDQWVERAQQALGLKPQQIGRVQGDVLDYKGKELVLGSLRSLCKPGRYPSEFYRSFGLLVADEVHRWAADQMCLAATQFYAKQRVGLTATFKRTDGKDLVVEAHIGKIEVEAKIEILKPKVLRFKTAWKCPRTRSGEMLPHTPGRIALVLKSIFSHGHRNRMICHFTRTAYQKGRRTVVFSDHLEHLEMLEIMLPKWGVPAHHIGRYYGSTTKSQLAHAAKQPVIVATYPKMAEGTDIPELDTLILAGPRSNIEQTLGRILREHSSKQQPVVFDLVDADSPVLVGYARKREQVYQRLGATVIEATIPDEELVA